MLTRYTLSPLPPQFFKRKCVSLETGGEPLPQPALGMPWGVTLPTAAGAECGTGCGGQELSIRPALISDPTLGTLLMTVNDLPSRENSR